MVQLRSAQTADTPERHPQSKKEWLEGSGANVLVRQISPTQDKASVFKVSAQEIQWKTGSLQIFVKSRPDGMQGRCRAGPCKDTRGSRQPLAMGSGRWVALRRQWTFILGLVGRKYPQRKSEAGSTGWSAGASPLRGLMGNVAHHGP